MHVIVTCKYEKDRMKNSREKVETSFFHHNPICYHGNRRLDLAEFQSNSSKLSCMLSLPASMKRIRSRKAEKKWRHRFPIISTWGFFQRAANSAVGGPIRPKFELVRALMHVIIACKCEKDRMKNSREKVETPLSPL